MAPAELGANQIALAFDPVKESVVVLIFGLWGDVVVAKNRRTGDRVEFPVNDERNATSPSVDARVGDPIDLEYGFVGCPQYLCIQVTTAGAVECPDPSL